MAKVFDYESYKLFLKEILAEQRGRGHQAQMARAAGCQPSYLAQALNTKVELTPDHAAGIANYLQLSAMELEYFLNLVHVSRATTPELRRILHDKLHELKAAHSTLSRRVRAAPFDAVQLSDVYYSSWIWMAIHVALHVKSYQTVAQLADRFSLPVQRVLNTLERLREMGAVKESDGKWLATEKSIHLPETSHMNDVSHRNWRQRAALDVEKGTAASIHYTSVFGMSRSDAQRLRSNILQMIQDAREVIEPSVSEDVFCLLCDFFAI